MASIFPRPGSGVQTVAVIVKSPTGSQRRIARSLWTKDAKLADKIGGAVQRLADEAKTANRRRLLRLVEDILDVAGVAVPWDDAKVIGQSFSSFSNQWLERKRRTSKPSTIAQAQSAIAIFLATYEDPLLTNITGQMVQDWFDAQTAQGLAASTVNTRLAILSSIFRHAVAMGAITINPAAGVLGGKRGSVVGREAIPDESFAKLVAYLSNRNDEAAASWITAAGLARYCGLRLQDAANLKCADIREQDDVMTICCKIRKTGKLAMIPVMEESLRRRLATLPQGEFACPALVGMACPRLSTHFTKLLEASGVQSPTVETASGRVHRQWGFHSLRHSFRSWLSRLGVPQHLSMVLMGHTSASVHEGYNHSTAHDLAKNLAPYLAAK